MNTGQKAVVNSIGSLVVFMAQWLISVFIVRVSGYADAGIFSLAMSESNIFSFFANYNIRNYQISDINNEYSQKQYFYSRIVTVLMSFVACIVYLSTASGYDHETKYAILIYLAYSSINVISDVMLGSLQIKGRLEVNGYSNIVRGVACFVGFVVAHLLRNLVVSLCVMVIADLLVTLVYDTSLYKKLEGKINLPDKSDIRAIYNILKCCFPLMLSTLFPIITAAVPRRKLQLLYGKEAVGIFSSIFNPTILIITLAPALILSAIPVLTDYWNQNEKVLFFSTVRKCYLICISVTLITELLALICGRPLMKLVFGDSILEYYNLLYWAIVATGINAMTSCGNAILISMRKKNVVVVASLLSMLCEFSCSEGLIRRYGIAGASHALLSAYAIQVFIQIGMMAYYIIRKNKEDQCNKKIVIDGRQLAGMMGGVQRYISEIVAELDKIVKPGEYEILIPGKLKLDVEYKNIKIVNYGILQGLLWEQICLPFYLWKNRSYGIFPCTIVPLLYPKGIAILHDVMMAKKPELGDSYSNPVAKKMLLLNYKIVAKHADIVVTVSENSKRDIFELYGTKNIYVIGNAWQHMNNIEMDDSWMKKYPEIKKGEYYFSLSANRKQKNFKWIYELAKRNPNLIFAIAGTQEEWQREQEYNTPNIIHLGYISDGIIKSLMHYCKAFLFPSHYEGFGIPPMEALAVGAKIIVAKTSCLPEIYKESAYYIDPYCYDIDLDKLLSSKVAPADEVLNRFSWESSAQKLYKVCEKLLDNKKQL